MITARTRIDPIPSTEPTIRHQPTAATKRMSRWWIVGLLALVLAMVAASYGVDEPLRRYMEATLNSKLQGYTARLPGLEFHPFGFSITLRGLTISQNAHPKPAVFQVPALEAGVHWRELLRLHLVADVLFDHPKVHVNLAQLRAEAADQVDIEDRGWQEALESIYPLKINELRVAGGDVVYIDDDPERPLHVSNLNVLAENIRNIRFPDRVYPSEIHVNATIFESGTMRLDGQANFLAKPHAGINANLALEKVELNYFKPILARANLWITKGALWAKGRIEYAPKVETVHLSEMTIRNVHIDYVHSAATAAQEAARAEQVEKVATEFNNDPVKVVQVDDLRIVDSTIAYVDKSEEPPFRVFLDNADLQSKNYSNQARSGPAWLYLTGGFMGSGDTEIQATFRPEKNPDFDVSVKIHETQMRSMNDLFQALGNFDVEAGLFLFYSELSIRGGNISGYVKPIFKDVNVYDRRQDAGEGLLHQVYEGIVGGLQTLLQNPRDEVATQADVSGTTSEPETSTLQIVFRLIQNAFFKAILPGLEHEIGRAGSAAEPPPQ